MRLHRLLPLLLALCLLPACSTLKPISYNAPPGLAHSEETLPGPITGTTLYGQTWLPADMPSKTAIRWRVKKCWND
ncbi:MAG: hypothetical protein ACRERR_09380 [Moraxellaceae bacterium]